MITIIIIQPIVQMGNRYGRTKSLQTEVGCLPTAGKIPTTAGSSQSAHSNVSPVQRDHRNTPAVLPSVFSFVLTTCSMGEAKSGEEQLYPSLRTPLQYFFNLVQQ